jgi:hypothetical protein
VGLHASTRLLTTHIVVCNEAGACGRRLLFARRAYAFCVVNE